MPLSPKVRSERRAQQKRLEDPKPKGRRVRCDNCDTRFYKTRKDHRFCKPSCRKEFFANGGNAFGPLKCRLEKLVREIMGAQHHDLEKRITALEASQPANWPPRP